MLSAASSAVILLISCIYLSEWFAKYKLLKWLYQTGQLSLTLYVAHVVIDMGVLEYIGKLENQTIEFSLFSSLLFCIFSMVFTAFWLKHFQLGPLE